MSSPFHTLFLANTLISGASVPTGSLEAQEAWNIAVGVCRLGVETTSARPAGSIEGKNYSVQGNTLASEEVVKAMARAFETTEGPLWDAVSMICTFMVFTIAS